MAVVPRTTDTIGAVTVNNFAEIPFPPGPSLAANQVLNGTAVQANLTVGTVATPLRAGAANMVGRKALIFSAGTSGFSYGFSAALQPFGPIPANTPVQLSIGENITVWMSKASGSNAVAVVELS